MRGIVGRLADRGREAAEGLRIALGAMFISTAWKSDVNHFERKSPWLWSKSAGPIAPVERSLGCCHRKFVNTLYADVHRFADIGTAA